MWAVDEKSLRWPGSPGAIPVEGHSGLRSETLRQPFHWTFVIVLGCHCGTEVGGRPERPGTNWREAERLRRDERCGVVEISAAAQVEFGLGRLAPIEQKMTAFGSLAARLRSREPPGLTVRALSR